MIACGQHHSLFIDPEGLVWSSGRNDQGQLGLGNSQHQHSFCQIQGVPSAVQVSAAVYGYHSAILDHQGNVYMFEWNNESQTGSDEEQTEIASPTKVLNLPSIIMVSCGCEHTIALDINGCLWGAGDNRYGQLSSEVAGMKEFTQITNNTADRMGRVTKISCGHWHSICQSDTGELWGTGHNNCGELGVGHCEQVDRFQKVLPLEDDVLMESFGCGAQFTIALDRDGGVWATGKGTDGQLGSGSREDKNKLTKMLNIPPMSLIICGAYSVIMKESNGKVYACGLNQCGQLGVGDNQVILSPQAVPDLPTIVQGCIAFYFSLVVDEEGGVWTSGRNEYGQHENKCSDRFYHIKGIRARTLNEKRFFNTKRAHQREE